MVSFAASPKPLITSASGRGSLGFSPCKSGENRANSLYEHIWVQNMWMLLACSVMDACQSCLNTMGKARYFLVKGLEGFNSFLLPWGSWSLNLCPKAWRQAHLPSQQSQQPLLNFQTEHVENNHLKKNRSRLMAELRWKDLKDWRVCPSRSNYGIIFYKWIKKIGRHLLPTPTASPPELCLQVSLALGLTFTGAIIYGLNGYIFPSINMYLIPMKETTATWLNKLSNIIRK